VSQIAAANSVDTQSHFAKLLAFETDCWDVHASLESGNRTFVLLDVRSPEAYARGHIAGAINLPHGRIIDRNLTDYSMGTLFVVYCKGRHCNGADRAAHRLAQLQRPVKKMIGGIAGWLDEGFSLVSVNA
jgi:rhodanese-related sulfurtransferase